ncbi:MAG: FAD/NAD(P)-binding protein [Chloracidobacterium sp.]|nr:FAD/NAD(P)-binding protein [Chloracidobacterium sp.]
MKRITIIGGGASGTLLAVNLMQNAGDSPVEINLVESRKRIGRGVAFGTSHDTHLLNVPAFKMGAFPDDVEHFHKWLIEKGHTFDAHDFVPRKMFGEYLRELFSKTAETVGSNVRLNLIDDEAVDLSVNGDSAELMLKSGEILPSNKVVLAFGNFDPPQPNVADRQFTSADKYFVSAWDARLFETVAPDDSIFIIGTGLSMVDVALHLHKHDHKGKITAISTRGLLPTVHKLGYTYPSFYDELSSMDRITDILKSVRRHIKYAEADDSNWRAVIDSLRPATQSLWLQLPIAEKRYFMQHLSRYWDVARHRMPPEAAVILDEMRASGKLETLKGRLKSITHADSGQFEIVYTTIDMEHSVSADAVVNCIGSHNNYAKLDSQFVKNLIARKHIRNDELSLGIKASPNGSVLDKNDQYSDVVFTLGTALKGVLWESTAIPEIRGQARDLALRLLADVR